MRPRTIILSLAILLFLCAGGASIYAATTRDFDGLTFAAAQIGLTLFALTWLERLEKWRPVALTGILIVAFELAIAASQQIVADSLPAIGTNALRNVLFQTLIHLELTTMPLLALVILWVIARQRLAAIIGIIMLFLPVSLWFITYLADPSTTREFSFLIFTYRYVQQFLIANFLLTLCLVHGPSRNLIARTVGIACSLGLYALITWTLFTGQTPPSPFLTTLSFVLPALAMSAAAWHARTLLMLAPSRILLGWVLVAVVALMSLLSISIALLRDTDSITAESLTRWTNGLNTSFFLLIPISFCLHRLTARTTPVGYSPLAPSAPVGVTCPICSTRHILTNQPVRCPCGVRIALTLQSPTCPQCNYRLIHLTSNHCPECGHAV